MRASADSEVSAPQADSGKKEKRPQARFHVGSQVAIADRIGGTTHSIDNEGKVVGGPRWNEAEQDWEYDVQLRKITISQGQQTGGGKGKDGAGGGSNTTTVTTGPGDTVPVTEKWLIPQ